MSATVIELEEDFKTDVATGKSEEEENNLCNQTLSLNQFPVNSAITENDAVRLHSLLTKGEKIPTKSDLNCCMVTLVEQRNAVKGWAKTRLVDKLISFAQNHKIMNPRDTTSLVTNLAQLEDAWQEDEKLAEKVWWVLFGEFDKWTGWETELEEEIMKKYQWEYVGFTGKTRSRRQKGCVAKIMVWQKAQIVKYVNVATLRPGSHGKSVCVTQPKEMLAAQGGKQKFRRPKGVFYPWMVRHHDEALAESNRNGLYSVDSEEEEEEDSKRPEASTDWQLKRHAKTLKVT